MDNDWVPPVIVALIIALCLVSLIVSNEITNSAYCSNKANVMQMNYEYKWLWGGGCYIEVEKDKWIPLDSYYYKQGQN